MLLPFVSKYAVPSPNVSIEDNMKNYLHSIDLSKTCRLCFSVKQDLHPIFKNDNIPDLCLKIKECVNLEVSNHDEKTPNLICTECIKEVEHWIYFKKKCTTANLRLKHYMKNLKYRNENISNTEDEEYDSVASTSTCDSDNKIFVDIILSECSNTILTEKCELRSMKFVGNGNNNNSNCSNGNGSDNIIKRFTKKNSERPKNMKQKQESQVLFRRKYNQYQRKKYPCDICDKKFTRFCDLFNHDKVDHESVPKNCMCNVCGKLFVSENRIQIHKGRYHSEKPFTCDVCDKKFLTKRTLQKHMIIHNKCYTCPYCGLCTSSNSSLIEHIRVHTREKPYTCDECGNSYISQQGLNSHKKTHSSEKLFMCDICGYSARNQSSIYIHKGSHSNVKPFICETCGKVFKSKIRLNEHHRRHTAVKRFTCDTCNMSFRQNYQLINHYRVHSGEKPYTCNVCSKSFARSDSLKEHMRIHTGEKRYTCQLCLAAFSFLKSFKTHKCDGIK